MNSNKTILKISFFITAIIISLAFLSCTKDIEIENLELKHDSIKGILVNNTDIYYRAVYIEFQIFDSNDKMIYQQGEVIFNVRQNEKREFSFERWDKKGIRIEVKRIFTE